MPNRQTRSMSVRCGCCDNTFVVTFEGFISNDHVDLVDPNERGGSDKEEPAETGDASELDEDAMMDFVNFLQHTGNS